MLKPLRFASPYYSRRAGRLAFSTIATALQSLLFIPALLLVRRAFDVAIPSGDVTGLIWIGAGIIGIRAATGGFSLLLRAFMLRTTRGAVADLRGDLMARLYSLSRRYFTRADYANLHTRIVQDTQRIEAATQKLFSVALPALLTVPVLAGILLYLNWRLFLLGLLLLPVLWFATRITSRHVRNQVVRNQRAFERFSKSVSFAINHIDLTRVRAFETEEVARQRSAIDGLSDSGHHMAMAFATHGQVQHTITYTGGICLLVAGGALVASGGMTIGELLAFFVAANQLGSHANTVLGSVPDVIATNQYFSTLRDVMTRGEPEPYSGTRKPDLNAGITVKNLTFAYEGAPILRDVSLSLPPGSNIAIIGPNGSGKSTLLHLLLGFYRPQEGALAVGDLEYDVVDMRELRRGFGLVPQRPAFFYGTVRENVAYGFAEASEAEVRAACRQAHADEFIQKLPEGYETPIGERGFRLSGGECQRLAIARALLGDPLRSRPRRTYQSPGCRDRRPAHARAHRQRTHGDHDQPRPGCRPTRQHGLLPGRREAGPEASARARPARSGRRAQGGRRGMSEESSQSAPTMDTAFKYDHPELSETAQLDFFDAILERTLSAEKQLPSFRTRLDVGGIQIELVFAGEILCPHILPALRPARDPGRGRAGSPNSRLGQRLDRHRLRSAARQPRLLHHPRRYMGDGQLPHPQRFPLDRVLGQRLRRGAPGGGVLGSIGRLREQLDPRVAAPDPAPLGDGGKRPAARPRRCRGDR